MSFDPRITLVLDGVADSRLQGVVEAESFAVAEPGQTTVPAAPVRSAPDADAEQVDQLLFGEIFERMETRGDFVFGQATRDGYVGWAPAAALSDRLTAPTHWVSALRTYAFALPSIKTAARGALSLNALVTVADETDTLFNAEGIGWIAKAHLSPIGATRSDPAAVALAHLGAPYLWGGRDSTGLDCSGLVQQALIACGHACPRDSDQQEHLGVEALPSDLRRGDLVFWKGHVSMMIDRTRMVHANAHHMAVAIEPLAKASARIAAKGGGDPIAFRTLAA